MSDHLQSPGGRASSDSDAQSGPAADHLIEQAAVAQSPRDLDRPRAARAGSNAPASAGVPLFLPPLPMRAGTMRCAEVIDLYMAHYKGRDTTRVQRLMWWQTQVGSVPLQDLSDDHVHAALEGLAQQHSRYFAGKDADGKAILKAKREPISGATINRYGASLAAVITWAIKSRVAPKGFVHPSRSITRRACTDVADLRQICARFETGETAPVGPSGP
jgi:hypothetical protein